MTVSALGHTEKNSVRVYVFRFALELGHCSTLSHVSKVPTADIPCATRGSFQQEVPDAKLLAGLGQFPNWTSAIGRRKRWTWTLIGHFGRYLRAKPSARLGRRVTENNSGRRQNRLNRRPLSTISNLLRNACIQVLKPNSRILAVAVAASDGISHAGSVQTSRCRSPRHTHGRGTRGDIWGGASSPVQDWRRLENGMEG